MTPPEILDFLSRRGVRLHVDGGRLLVSHSGQLTDELRRAMAAHKDALIALLTPDINPDVDDVAIF